ncbi:AAA family ATPase [Olsenella uli]|uniref:AAA family ATPase n=1 Tax=Olsenella uli TaxID=133926 RepID=UPI00195E9723|nr:AAA family ATPase [Olsenella uli]MBM6816686.1 AAA family ATPase [Olsenella uli]
MLCQFTFSNYRSYRDEATLTMQASSMREFSRSLLPGGDSQSFLPVAAIYGPNAGGKSNLIEALGYVQSAVARPILSLTRGPEGRDDPAPRLPRCAPFAFDGTHGALPSEFEVYYRVSGYEYRYTLAVSSSEIVGESLARRKVGASRAARLFDREGGDVDLGPSLRRAGVSTGFNPAIPYLSYLYMNTDLEPVRDAASWFLGSVVLDYNSFFLEHLLEDLLDEGDSPETTRFLRAVDVHVDGFRVERDGEGRRQRVFVRHRVGGSDYELRLSEESAGTQKLMGLARVVMSALEEGGTVLVDELDAKLHPKLLRYVILLFKDPEVNRGGAQLIFTSQDVSTMRNDVFRRDEIWFAARDEDEASRLWSLSDLHEPNGNLVSKNAAFDRQYLSGRYGADPYLTRIEEWE